MLREEFFGAFVGELGAFLIAALAVFGGETMRRGEPHARFLGLGQRQPGASGSDSETRCLQLLSALC